jgi:hypothetical protein
LKEGKVQLKINELAKYKDIQEDQFFISEQPTYINNLPFQASVILTANKETNLIDMAICLQAKSMDDYTMAELVFL